MQRQADGLRSEAQVQQEKEQEQAQKQAQKQQEGKRLTVEKRQAGTLEIWP